MLLLPSFSNWGEVSYSPSANIIFFISNNAPILFHSHIILLQVVKWKFSNKVRQSYNFEDDRKNETITLTMDPVKGKVVYNANCVSCHNNDPNKQGSFYPQIYCSSKELLSKKINYGIYVDHCNVCPAHLEAWWNLVNWVQVAVFCGIDNPHI